jgi:hypothetical protein
MIVLAFYVRVVKHIRIIELRRAILVVHDKVLPIHLNSDKISFGRVFFLSGNLKLITFATYNNNFDVRIKFQFFSKF